MNGPEVFGAITGRRVEGLVIDIKSGAVRILRIDPKKRTLCFIIGVPLARKSVTSECSPIFYFERCQIEGMANS